MKPFRQTFFVCAVCRGLAACVIVVLLGSIAAVSAAPEQPAADMLILRRETIHDDMAACDAATILVPQGWKLESAVHWRVNPQEPAHIDLHIYNPDGAEDMHLYPKALYNDGLLEIARKLGGWGPWNDVREGGRYYCTDLRRRMGPADYIKNVLIPQSRKDLQDARIVDVKDEPALAQSIVQAVQNFPGFTCTAQRVRFEYAVHGIAVEEDVYCAIPVLALPNGTFSWAAQVQSYRAAKGKLDDTMGLFRTLNFSLAAEIEWVFRIADVKQTVAVMVQSRRDAEAEQARIIAGAQARINDIGRAMFAHQRALQEQSLLKWDEVFRGTRQCEDPFTGHKVEVPAGYRYGFTNPMGEKIMTNNPNYDPNQVHPHGLHDNWRAYQLP